MSEIVRDYSKEQLADNLRCFLVVMSLLCDIIRQWSMTDNISVYLGNKIVIQSEIQLIMNAETCESLHSITQFICQYKVQVRLIDLTMPFSSSSRVYQFQINLRVHNIA